MNERIREIIKQHYKETADQVFLLREVFKESGFTDGEAFTLTECYCRQTILDNLVRDSKLEVLERYKKLNQLSKEVLNKEKENVDDSES